MQQFIHQLNNTEIGRKKTHEKYVLVSQCIAPELCGFLPLNQKIKFQYKRSGKHYDLKLDHVKNNEYRVTGLGPLYKEAEPDAGDLIVFEVHNGHFFVDFIFQKSVIVFFHSKGDCFECLNEKRLTPNPGQIPCFFNNDNHILQISNAGTRQKRRDSTTIVNLYKLIIDGVAINKGDFNLFFDEMGAFLVPAYPDSIRRMEQA